VAATLFVLTGAVAYAAIYHVWHWRGLGTERLHFWAAVWSANTILFLMGRLLTVTAGDQAGVAMGIQLAWMSAAALIVAAIGLGGALAERVHRRLTLATVAFAGLMIVLISTTGLVVTSEVYVRIDRLGFATATVRPGPLLPFVGLAIVLAFVYFVVTVGRAPSLRPPERRSLLVCSTLYALTGLNDTLHVARLIDSVLLFHFGFVVISLNLTYLLAHRYRVLRSRLEEEVRARTSELEGLVRAGRTVMSGLALDATLKRIVDEAARIAGTPHLSVLLLDPQRRVLRLAAAGGAHVDTFEVPLDGSHSGAVATTRRPLFVPATQTDPYQLPDFDRERGIVTYLGLPIQSGEAVLGVLAIGTEQPRAWSGQQIEVLSSFADQAAVALTNAHLYEAEAAARAAAEDALAQVRTLQGLLPICAWCKRIRNDDNYWVQIESYVTSHTAATFTHGICPECRAKALDS